MNDDTPQPELEVENPGEFLREENGTFEVISRWSSFLRDMPAWVTNERSSDHGGQQCQRTGTDDLENSPRKRRCSMANKSHRILVTGRATVVVYRCDICGKVRECVQKIIEQKEYDFCRRCWASLARKLSGKGRRLGQVEIALIPARLSSHECVEGEPTDEGSPEILSGLKKPN